MPQRSSADPRWLTVVVGLICLGMYTVLTLLLGGIKANRLAIALDLILLAGGIFLWIFFFAQFTLPVKKPAERFRAALRLLLYLLGIHGPAVRIENGQVVQRAEEARKRGPGVLIVDPASAAVLRTGTTFTRPVGPGIHFLHYDRRKRSGEYLAGVVDLRPQVCAVGPAPREDPFSPRFRQETPEAYKLRQDRRWETSGLTRDGIEVVPSLSITFRIDTRASEGAGGFGYNPHSVWRAVTAEGVDPTAADDDPRRTVSWEWLPSRLAIDVWREYLRMFTMDELFSETHSGRTGLETILEMLRQRLTQARLAELNEYGRPAGRPIISPEYALLVRRGLRVLSISVPSVRMPAPVEEQLTRRWESTWLVRARQEQEALERKSSYARETGQTQALREYALAAAHDFSTSPSSEEPDSVEMAGKLLDGSLRLLIRDPELHKNAAPEKAALIDLLTRVRQKP